jgi:hypothetical protein
MAIEMLTQLAVNLIDAQVRQLITARRVQVDTEESLSQDELQAKIREQLAAICLDHSLSLAIDDGLTFEQFFLEHYETVRQRVYAAGLDLELAEDATQNAMIIALQYWERISVMESPIAYVTTTAINLLRRVRRKEAAALHVEPRKINPGPLAQDHHGWLRRRANNPADPGASTSRHSSGTGRMLRAPPRVPIPIP